MNLMVQHVDGMRFLVTADGHAVVVDAAPQDGGGGTAMSGPQLFVAATGACILEFVANSCRLRGVPVEHLSMEMTFQEMSRPRRVGGLMCRLDRSDGDPPCHLHGYPPEAPSGGERVAPTDFWHVAT